MLKRSLILEDGTVLTGNAFGSEGQARGEVVFYAGMTGYQEMLTDPNYNGHIVTLTYPLVGNYGINRDDFESIVPYVEGIVVKECCNTPSNFRSEKTLDAFLKEQGIPGISGIDTRMLTRILRKKGTMRGIITAAGEETAFHASLFYDWESRDFVKEASITKPYIVPGRGARITVIDLGLKHSILYELTARQCNVTVVPYDYTAEDIMRFKPDGVLVSNGPGDPKAATATLDAIKDLLGNVPLFGIGLGHQLLALACGADTKKLHVGKYGTNFAIKDLAKDKTFVATESRHFTVDEPSLGNTDLEVTFRETNDGSIAGLKHKRFPAISVQFNPEGAPGPSETNYLFDDFLDMIEKCKRKGGAM